MPIMSVVLSLAAVGVVLWLINQYVPMDGKIKSILNAVVVIFVVLWLLRVFTAFDAFGSLRNYP